MGGNSTSTPQGAGSQLQQMFMQQGQAPSYSGGYQQQPIAPIAAPQYPAPLTPTPEQAAASTVARMQARTPPAMAAPVTAPKREPMRGRGGEGGSR